MVNVLALNEQSQIQQRNIALTAVRRQTADNEMILQLHARQLPLPNQKVRQTGPSSPDGFGGVPFFGAAMVQVFRAASGCAAS